jgi:hypothetical protein
VDGRLLRVHPMFMWRSCWPFLTEMSVNERQTGRVSNSTMRFGIASSSDL